MMTLFLVSFILGVIGLSLGMFQLGYSKGIEWQHKHEDD
jgi:hypothetical protein